MNNTFMNEESDADFGKYAMGLAEALSLELERDSRRYPSDFHEGGD